MLKIGSIIAGLTHHCTKTRLVLWLELAYEKIGVIEFCKNESHKEPPPQNEPEVIQAGPGTQGWTWPSLGTGQAWQDFFAGRASP